SCADAGQLYAALAPAFDVEYVGLVTVGAADPSYTAPCLELIGNGADNINLGVTSATGLSILEECELPGYEGTFSGATTTISAKDFEGVDGLHLVGMVNGFPWWSDDAPVQQFRDVVEEYGDGDDVRSPAGTSTWATLELFRKAMGERGPAA